VRHGEKGLIMAGLIKAKATICIVNYKTPDFIRLCLRSIRKFTDYPYEVIVVDNGSNDESLEYLKRLRWVRLIERDTSSDPEKDSGGYSHAAGLDTGLAQCRTEFFVTLHSDTFIVKSGWLGYLAGCFGSDEKTACVGTGKVELTPEWKIIIKKLTDWRTFKRKLLRTPDPAGKFRYFNRTICSAYRTDVLQREKLSFLADRNKGLSAGQKLYHELIDRGYKTIALPIETMSRYIIHLAHATQAENWQEFSLRKKTIRKYNRLAEKILYSGITQQILNDDSLDN
jgi:hypothetical protein